MSKHKVLMMDAGHPGQMEAMEDHFDVVRLSRSDPESIVRAHQSDIQAISTFLTPVRQSLIKAFPALEIIAVGAVGLDHIDLQTAKSRNITITNTPDVLTDDTADIAMMLMLALARRGVEGDAYVRAGLWVNGALPLGRTLSGKTIGILGLGRIGQAVARRAEAFHMNVIYSGPAQKPEHPYTYFKDLKRMAEQCDFLVLTCKGGDETKHIIDYDVLKALGPDGFVVNIARGSVIHQQDLLMALSNKAIAGAGLDVYESEPNVPEELVRMDNVVLTPHIGSATLETRSKMGEIVVQNLIEHFKGGRLLTPVRL
jgi:lactate dehydrogenase-like 2-hydroxyacid dehydrogenase